MPSRLRGRRRSGGSERGASALELVLYMPLLVTMMFLTIQFSLIYLGNQVVSAAARQAARIARVGAGTPAALAKGQAAGQAFIAQNGHGLVTATSVSVSPVAPDQVRANVNGTAIQLIPFWRVTQVSSTVQGPVETFRPDQ